MRTAKFLKNFLPILFCLFLIAPAQSQQPEEFVPVAKAQQYWFVEMPSSPVIEGGPSK